LSLNALANINIELTSKCNKLCKICGRVRRRKEFPEDYGDMDFELVKKISEQVPDGIMVQLHNNGEPLLYPRFGDAVKLFKNHITSITTNGKLIVEKAEEIINNLNSISISIIQDDPEAEEQLKLIEKFIGIRGVIIPSPIIVLRFVGNVDELKYKDLLNMNGVIRAKRVIHLPNGSIEYTHLPTIPEFGICVEFLRHLAIDRHGNCSCCVRFDPLGELRLGNIKYLTLEEIWNGEKRMKMFKLHVSGRRNEIPYCGYKCHFYGIPISGE